MSPFETYRRRGSRGLNRLRYPAISIQPKAQRLAFNQRVAEALGLTHESGELVLLFNRREGLIALRAPGKQEPGDALLRITWTKTDIGSVFIPGFAILFGVDLEAIRGEHRLGYDDRSGLHMFRLPAGAWEKPEGDGRNGHVPAASMPRTIQRRREAAG